MKEDFRAEKSSCFVSAMKKDEQDDRAEGHGGGRVVRAGDTGWRPE